MTLEKLAISSAQPPYAADNGHVSPIELFAVRVPLDSLLPIPHQIDFLMTSEGILASGNADIFNRVFVRDGAKVADDKLAIRKLFPEYDVSPAINALLALLKYQAKVNNPTIGKYKGSFGHEHGSNGYPAGWPVNENGVGENYDSADGTHLALIGLHKALAFDQNLLAKILPEVIGALEWSMANCARFNGWPAYIGAEFDPERRTDDKENPPPGLRNHRWTDSGDSLVHEDGSQVPHPITGVEVVGLTWAAHLRWADTLHRIAPQVAKRLRQSAQELKTRFNTAFPYTDSDGAFIADAIDGNGKQVCAITCNPAILLAAEYNGQTIIEDDNLTLSVIRRMVKDLYDPRGGLRTISPRSTSHPDSIYHGPYSLWPHVQSDAVQGFDAFAKRVAKSDPAVAQEVHTMALAVAEASLRPGAYFGSPVETIQIPDNGGIELYVEYNDNGTIKRTSCMVQAFAGAAMEYNIAYLQHNGIQEVTIFRPA